MAITINQTPTSPNMSNSDFVFNVESNQSVKPQFQFVVDIFESGSAAIVQRVKQQPNPNSYGVFNLRQILSYQMGSDNVFKIPAFATSSLCNKDFIIKFGEEYSTSYTAPVTLYNGSGAVGAPAKIAIPFYTITDGLVETNNSFGYNFDYSDKYITEIASNQNPVFSYQTVLSNAPLNKVIKGGEYETISFYNGNVDNDDIEAQDVFSIYITFYNNATTVQSTQYFNVASEGGAPRTVTTEDWIDVYLNQTNKSRLMHFGCGLQNIIDNGVPIPTTWTHYTVTAYAQSDDDLENINAIWFEKTFTNDPNVQCEYPGVRFAWKNEYGVWDYFTFTLADATNSSVSRLDYEQTFVPYSTSTPNVPYSVSRRGTKGFNNKIKSNSNVSSNWLNQEESDWLSELFFSTNVYIQKGNDFIPIKITSSTLTKRTNPRTQKVFNYDISYELANQPRSRF